MEEKGDNEYKYSNENHDSPSKFSSLQNVRNGFLDTLSNTSPKSASQSKKKKTSLSSLKKTVLQDDEKKEQAEKESIKYEKYKGLSDVLALWYTAQDQLAKGKNPKLVTKYGIRLNASKQTNRNKVLKMVTEIRRHTELMTICRNRDPSSINEEDDEEVDEGQREDIYGERNVPRSCRSFQELTAPRHQPVGYDRRGIL